MLKELLNKLRNPYIFAGVVSAGVLIVQQFGIPISDSKVRIVVDSVCSIGTLLGIFACNVPQNKNQ